MQPVVDCDLAAVIPAQGDEPTLDLYFFTRGRKAKVPHDPAILDRVKGIHYLAHWCGTEAERHGKNLFDRALLAAAHLLLMYRSQAMLNVFYAGPMKVRVCVRPLRRASLAQRSIALSCAVCRLTIDSATKK